MALVMLDPKAVVDVRCWCGHGWKSTVKQGALRAKNGAHSWDRHEIQISAQFEVVDRYCTRCGEKLERVAGVVDGDDRNLVDAADEVDLPEPVVSEAYAAPEPAVGHLEEISAAI